LADVEQLNSLLQTPRCSKSSGDDEGLATRSDPPSRRKRYVLNKKKWSFTDLSWQLSDPFLMFPNQTDFQIVRDVLGHAFGMWSTGSRKVLALKDLSTLSKHSRRTVSQVPDIEIFFATGDHGDHEPFDGPGGIVAHSGYPMEGKVHFDAAELWTVGGKRGIDFRYVALHELGHALGLRHSQQNDSIMYPIYIRSAEDLSLSDDDIFGIQELYSSPFSKIAMLNGAQSSSFKNQSSVVGQRNLTFRARKRNGRRKRLKHHNS